MVIPRVCSVCFYLFSHLSYFPVVVLHQLGIRANFNPQADSNIITTPQPFHHLTHQQPNIQQTTIYKRKPRNPPNQKILSNPPLVRSYNKQQITFTKTIHHQVDCSRNTQPPSQSNPKKKPSTITPIQPPQVTAQNPSTHTMNPFPSCQHRKPNHSPKSTFNQLKQNHSKPP